VVTVAARDSGMFPATRRRRSSAVDGSIAADLYLDDVNSIVSLGGRFRTEPEYRALLAEAGFDLTVHVMPAAPAGYTLLEATPRR
jgi:hypothetical protein